MNLPVIIGVLFIIFFPFVGLGQEGRFKSISVKVFSGAHLYSGVDLVEKVNYGYEAVDARFAWHPVKENEWTEDTGFAAYGFGFYSANIGDPQVFGNPNAIYAFANFFLSKPHKRNVLEISPALGLTYNLNAFDAEENPLNDAIGARLAVYFNVNFGGAYKVNRELDVLYGVDFTHFSNGRTFTPNYGLNLIGFNVGMRYHFNQEQRDLDRDPYTTNVVPARFLRPERPPSQKMEFNNSVDVYAAIGTVQNYEDQGTDLRYGAFSGVVDYRKYFNRMHGLTVGLDLFYDGSLAEYYDENSDHYLVGVHAGYDFMFWRFDIRVQLGTYLTDDRGKDFLFIRPALQYEISKSFFAQVGLKTRNGAGADWIEFGLGWKPFRW
ncbi:acyloxyacyl hydrolase [Robertkochia sediminum]|uniref:acyloxyacyl hydrolase n=1 Tax=Robertkochia sediminum TaxID=2785326 RepID=UPI001931D987|nr:acyloxyacyl hydrolase [Robertkochia sediminum]MBL7473104.1 acyloxyacyl hydrolase [Robertkochia sediminum]